MEGLLIMCFTALCTLLALCFLKYSAAKGKAKLPPGPWTLPIIGSLHHVISKVPHRKMLELSGRYGPVMFLKLGEIPTVVVSSAEAASLMLKSDIAFSDRTRSVTFNIFSCDGKDIAIAPYGDHWRQMRKICVMELLSSKQVRRKEDIRADVVHDLIRSITALDGATVNVTKMVSAVSNNIVTRAVFGGKFTQQDEYISQLNKVFTLSAGSSLVDLFPSSQLVRWFSKGEREVRRCYDGIQRIIADIVDERKATRDASDGISSEDDEDLLGALLRLQLEDKLEFPLTTDVMGAVLFDIFAGGTDTSSSALEWAMTELVTNPRVMAKAQLEIRQVLGEHRTVITNSDVSELPYMRNVIKEVLRLHPPVPLFARSAREDCQIMGYDISRGTEVFVNLFAICKDEKYWKNAEEFKPERFEGNNIDYHGTYFQYIPFGAGRRQCPGMMFATSTVDIVLANLLYHFDWMLPDGASLASFDMSEKYRLTLMRKNNLELKVIPHVWSNGIPSK